VHLFLGVEFLLVHAQEFFQLEFVLDALRVGHDVLDEVEVLEVVQVPLEVAVPG